jgi:hypothetical protein
MGEHAEEGGGQGEIGEVPGRLSWAKGGMAPRLKSSWANREHSMRITQRHNVPRPYLQFSQVSTVKREHFRERVLMSAVVIIRRVVKAQWAPVDDKECNEEEDLINSVTSIMQEEEELLQALDATEAEKLGNELTYPNPSPVLQLIADLKRVSQMTNASFAFDAAEVVKCQKPSKLVREPAISSSFDGRGGGNLNRDEDDEGRARPDDQAKRGLVLFSHRWRDILDSDSEDATDAADRQCGGTPTGGGCGESMQSVESEAGCRRGGSATWQGLKRD